MKKTQQKNKEKFFNRYHKVLIIFAFFGLLFANGASAEPTNGFKLASDVFISAQQAFPGTEMMLGIFSSFSELLNILLIILAIFLLSTLYNLVESLHQGHYSLKDKLKVIPPLVSKSASKSFTDHSHKDENGTYTGSFDQHKRLHGLTRKVIGGTGAVIGAKIVLVLMIGYFLSVQLPTQGIAQSFPYTQNGQVVQRNDVLTYIMEFENTGNADALNVVLTDSIDTSKVDYVPGSGKITKNGIETTGGITFDGTTVSFDIGTVTQGMAGNVVFSVVVIDNPANEGQIIVNNGELAASNFALLTSNVVSNPIGAAVAVDTVLAESGFEGIFEPLCCAGGGTACDFSGNSTEDVNCVTGEPLLGTHKHQLAIPFGGLPLGLVGLNCSIAREGQSAINLDTSINLATPDDVAKLDYKLTAIDNVAPGGETWTITGCTYNISGGGTNTPVPGLTGQKILVHGNTWTGVDTPTSDAKRALDCYTGALGVYFDNTKQCDFAGDVAFALALASNASVEGVCNDGIDNDGNGIIDCNDSSCRGLSYPSCQLVGGALIASGGGQCAGNICTGSVDISGKTITYAYTQHAAPGGKFKVMFNNGSVSNTTGGIANYVSFIPKFDGFGKYAAPGGVTLPDDSIFPDAVNPITYQTQATSIDGLVNQVMWVDLKSTTSTSASDPFELLMTYNGGLQRVTGLQVYPDTLAPTNEDESQNVSSIGLTNSCADGIDNDLDFVTDCRDTQCNGEVGQVSSGALCEYATELTCNDGFDNDGDGVADCLDSDCNGRIGGFVGGQNVYCEFGTEQASSPGPNHCTDGFDNDADGTFDCADQGACWKQNTRGCAAVETSCSDGIDNDLDSDYSNNFDTSPTTGVDCTDYDCAGDPVCPTSEFFGDGSSCFDGIDNDLDGLIDCFDAADCSGVEFGGQACLEQEFVLGVANLCTDNAENDFDEPTPRLDCADNQANRVSGSSQATDINDLSASDCWARFDACGPCPSTEFITYDSCADNIDNDYDDGIGGYGPGSGGRDCSDSDCSGRLGNYAGAVCGGEICDDNFDNDADGRVDCRDSDCAGQAGPNGISCQPAGETSCSDGIDNDFGGGADCFDTDCEGIGNCALLDWSTTSCTPVPFTTSWVNMVSGGSIQYRHSSRIYENAPYSLEFRGQANSYDSVLITIGQGQFPFDVFGCTLSGSSNLVYSATEAGVGKIQNNTSPIDSFAVTLECPTTGFGVGFSSNYPMALAANGSTGIELGQSSTNPQVTIYENVPPIVSGIEVEGEVGGTVRVPYGSSIGVRGLPGDVGTGNSGICGCSITIDGSPVSTGNACETSITNIIKDGPIAISASAIDGASNSGGASNDSVTVDVTPVEIGYQKLSRAYYNSSISTLNTGTFRFRTSTNGSFGNCNAEIKNSGGATVFTTTLTKSGTNDITCGGSFEVGSFVDGQYTLEVTVTDEDNDSVTSSKVFYVCNNPLSPGCETMDMDNDGFPENTSTDLYASIQGGTISCDMCPSDLNTGIDSDGDGIDDACDPDSVVLCGNNSVDPGETCDDGNRTNGDGCSSSCQTEITSICGNGIVEGIEECDDGNTAVGDGCSDTCQVETAAACGNNALEIGETCDDGNLLAGDGCNQFCQTEDICGNGIIEGIEQCDDGNTANGDGCDSTCQSEVAAVCGNTILDQGEQCDDGNTISGDGCSAACVSEVPAACGNNILEAGETCDDGNTISGDGCSAICYREGQGIIAGIAPPTISSIEIISAVPMGDEDNQGKDKEAAVSGIDRAGTIGGEFARVRMRITGSGSRQFEKIKLTVNSETKEYLFAFAFPGPWVREIDDVFSVGDHSVFAQGVDSLGNTTPRGPEFNFTIDFMGPPLEEPFETIGGLLEENVVDLLPKGITNVIDVAKDVPGVREVVDNPEVENVLQKFIAPGIITVALVNTIPAVSVGLINILPYLHLIFIEPIRALFKKKRKKWGVIYNSLSKRPIDLAVVRLYNKDTRQLIQTKVTDAQGRYIILVKDPGSYYLQVVKPDFVFPTDYLKDDKSDSAFIDLYHGEEVEVKEEGTVITANIPLDPIEAKIAPEKEVVKNFIKEKAQIGVSLSGIVLAIVSFIIYPTVLISIFLVLHIGLYALFRKLAAPKHPKSWGIVYDQSTKKPIKHAIVRVFDTKFNKLLETQVTDGKGHYSFLVGKNVYQLVAEKEGYQQEQIKPVDKTKKEQIVDLDVGLKKKG